MEEAVSATCDRHEASCGTPHLLLCPPSLSLPSCPSFPSLVPPPSPRLLGMQEPDGTESEKRTSLIVPRSCRWLCPWGDRDIHQVHLSYKKSLVRLMLALWCSMLVRPSSCSLKIAEHHSVSYPLLELYLSLAYLRSSLFIEQYPPQSSYLPSELRRPDYVPSFSSPHCGFRSCPLCCPPFSFASAQIAEHASAPCGKHVTGTHSNFSIHVIRRYLADTVLDRLPRGRISDDSLRSRVGGRNTPCKPAWVICFVVC
ncbi:hypothetical protein V8E55_008881 [Tylopilus felleus]